MSKDALPGTANSGQSSDRKVGSKASGPALVPRTQGNKKVLK